MIRVYIYSLRNVYVFLRLTNILRALNNTKSLNLCDVEPLLFTIYCQPSHQMSNITTESLAFEKKTPIHVKQSQYLSYMISFSCFEKYLLCIGGVTHINSVSEITE